MKKNKLIKIETVKSTKKLENSTIIFNPYISAALTRMGLLNIPSAVPEDLEGQADYWKDNWNTKSGDGTRKHFIKQSEFYFDETPDESFMDDIVNPGYQSAFLDTMV